MNKDKIYVGDINFLPEVCAGEELAESIELVEITLREEVVYDVNLAVEQKVTLAKMLDRLNIPIIQMHAQGASEIIAASRDAGVTRQFEIICRPYHSYGYDDWQQEIRAAVKAGADIIKPSITNPRKWMMGDPSMSSKDIAQRAIDAVKCAFDNGACRVTLAFTDAPRSDLSYMIDIGGKAAELGPISILLNDTVGVAKPSAMRYLVQTIKQGTGAGIRVHCHNDFGLATANTVAAIEAGATSVETVVNGADPARSGIAPLAEVVMAVLCLYGKDLGIATEHLTEASNLFADLTGMPIPEQMPVVAERNWMYKRDHIMRTIIQDESIQFPFSPSLVGQTFRIGMGRGSGPVGVKAKLKELGVTVSDDRIPDLVERICEEAVQRKRRLTDDEVKRLV